MESLSPDRSVGHKPLGEALPGMAAGVLVGAAGLLSVLWITRQGLSFDGAMHMQVPYNLLQHGRYATSYHEIRDFAGEIQTGIPLLLPVAAVFRLCGVSAVTAQVPNALYLVMTAWAAAAVAGCLAGRWAAALAALMFICTPGLFDYGLRGYGEIPALFFLVLHVGLWAHAERRGRVGLGYGVCMGLALGLSILTKTVMLVAVPAVVLVAAADLFWSRKLAGRVHIGTVLGILLVLGTFEGFKLSVLGNAYAKCWGEQTQAVLMQSGVAPGLPDTAGTLSKLRTHLGILGDDLHMPVSGLLVFLALPYAVVGTEIVRKARTGGRGAVPLALAVLAITALAYLAWWLALTPTSKAWPRRAMSAVILHEMMVVAAIGLSASRWCLERCLGETGMASSRLRVLNAGVLIVTAAASASFVLQAGRWNLRLPPRRERAQPAEFVAKAVSGLPLDARVYGRGWWQAPELSFLSGRVFYDLERMSTEEFNRSPRNYFATDPYVFAHAPGVVLDTLGRCEHTCIASREGYGLYRVSHLRAYVPFSDGERAQCRKGSVDFFREDYLLVRRMAAGGKGPRLAQAECAVLLRHSGEKSLRLKLRVPELAGYDGQDVRLAVSMDGKRLGERAVSEAGDLDFSILLPVDETARRGVKAVEFSLNKRWHRSGGDRAKHEWVLGLKEIGFSE